MTNAHIDCLSESVIHPLSLETISKVIFSRYVVGRITSPSQRCPALMPGTWEYVTLHGKRE